LRRREAKEKKGRREGKFFAYLTLTVFHENGLRRKWLRFEIFLKERDGWWEERRREREKKGEEEDFFLRSAWL